MDPNQIEDAIKHAENKGLNTRAIIPVDLFGLPARYRIISDLAKKHNLFILEDAAQGFGGEIRGQKAGSFGDVASTSFFPAKPLGCYGDGGAIFTNDEELAQKMRSIRIHGSGSDKYENVRLGINGRLDTLQAVILLEKLSIFNNELKLRNKVADYYSDNISGSFKKPFIPREYFSSWAQYALLSQSESDRSKIMTILSNENIPSMIYYKLPLHLQIVMKRLGYKEGDFPISERISKQIFSIPMHPYLDKNQQNRIIEILNSI
jgi:dTDP-4-amino-4,6-dideoxygalactose transaminase